MKSNQLRKKTDKTILTIHKLEQKITKLLNQKKALDIDLGILQNKARSMKTLSHSVQGYYRFPTKMGSVAVVGQRPS